MVFFYKRPGLDRLNYREPGSFDDKKSQTPIKFLLTKVKKKKITVDSLEKT